MSRRSGRRSVNLDSKKSSGVRSELGLHETDASLRDRRHEREISAEEDDGDGEEEEEEEEEEEVTRCICGEDELQNNLINPELAQFLRKEFKIDIDQGLFIQCDKCSVWQHGYCVGLYENDDVPDKYWCERCKPELHIIVQDPFSDRTLYKPVNDHRKKIEQFGKPEDVKPETSDKKKKTLAAVKEKRKDRRLHHQHEDEDEYDKQLQKALRESAKESGIITVEEADTSGRISPRKRPNRTATATGAGASTTGSGSNSKSTSEQVDDMASSRPKRIKSETEAETENEAASTSNKSEILAADVPKSRSKSKKKKKDSGGKKSVVSNSSLSNPNPTSTSTVSSSSSSSSSSSVSGGGAKHNHKSDNAESATSKEELIQLPFKPRFVNDKATFHDLRKRTSAIIEWIARTQRELQDEKSHKLELFSFTPDTLQVQQEKRALEQSFDLKGAMIDELRQKINEWELQFGKYAPS
ncbi:uncharacterized protein LODBEIA_P40910 [Lodderomyces beijingensis]|uniref:Zinc finger PHD-type domain-containing protein n=1 Tax=Lodderomyces beijingensis TaxID=1775926 RepID=A0ABP0ZP14_9ASCO